jgi:acyl-coenzyme A thioesterase 13
VAKLQKMASKVATEGAANLMKYFKNTKTFCSVLEKVKIVSIGEGKCRAEFKVEEIHTNPMGGLHGGMSATLVDTLSTYTLTATLGRPKVSSVTIDMHVSYLKGAKVGDEILINANMVKTGKSMAFFEVEIRNKISGDILVKGKQSQFLVQ